MSDDVAIRAARRSDAADMALLANIAGHGLPSFVWSRSEGVDLVESPLEIGRLRALRDEGSFSWRNAVVAATDDEVAGMLVGYRQPDEMQADTAGADPIFAPLIELEAEAPGTWYINILAVYSNWRGSGIGSRLIGTAHDNAAESGARGLSLIAADDNEQALRFYDRNGFRERAARPLVPYPGGPKSGRWLLMVKD
jgi:ribosomal protein S18 acetylase RimI-like enzyme